MMGDEPPKTCRATLPIRVARLGPDFQPNLATLLPTLPGGQGDLSKHGDELELCAITACGGSKRSAIDPHGVNAAAAAALISLNRSAYLGVKQARTE